MPRPKGKDRDKEKRDAEIYQYYANLISPAVGYSKPKARELTRERFSSWNLSVGRIENIIYSRTKKGLPVEI